MKVKWYGMAAFLLASEEGVRVIADPYEAGSYEGRIGYSEITDEADIVTVSHDHGDHNFVSGVRGNPQVVKGPGVHRVKGIEFKGIAAYHDKTKGSERGPNTIFSFTMDGIKICHLGDLGHRLDDQSVAEIGEPDLLLTPVGGRSQIDANEATELYQRLKAKVIIPMHYKTDKCGFQFDKVDEFTKNKENVRRLLSCQMELKKSDLPSTSQIVVLEHAP